MQANQAALTPFYADGMAELYHGDCAQVLSRLNVRPQLILTSPPYDNLRAYGGETFDFDRVADSLVNIMDSGSVLVWVVGDATIDGSETGTSFRQALGFLDRGLKLHDTMIYLKTSGMAIKGNSRHKNSFEYMFVFTPDRPALINIIEDRAARFPGRHSGMRRRMPNGELAMNNAAVTPPTLRRSNVWEYSPGFRKSAPDFPDAHRHPAIFPLALARDHIRTWTEADGLVLDPMAGSGTVLMAAKDMGRPSVGMDVNLEYCQLASRRLGQQVFDLGGCGADRRQFV